MRYGLRRRLVAVAAGFVLGGLVLGGFVLGALLEASLTEAVDERTQTEARWLRRSAGRLEGPDRPPDEGALKSWVAGLDEGKGTALAMRRLDGTVLLAGPVPWPQAPQRGGSASDQPQPLALPEDAGWRAATVVVDTRQGPVECAVFRTTDAVSAAMYALYGLLVFIGLLALASAAAVASRATGILNRALAALESSAREIVTQRGRARVPSTAPAREFGELAGSLNALAESFEHTLVTLAAERDRFEAVLEGLSDAVLALNAEDRIVLCNQAATALLELDTPPLGRRLVEVTRVPMLAEMLDRLGRERRVTMEFDWQQGRRRRLLARAGALKASGGRVIVIQDLTALRRLETVRRDFVANVSHELRTPVGVILATAETLLDGALDDPGHGRPFVEALHRHAERLARLVSDLLDLSRIEAGQFQMAPAPLDVREAVARVFDQLAAKAAKHGTALVNDVPAGTEARADGKAVEQVLVNLADNALKYAPEGSRVRVFASAGSEALRVCVEDNGPGIEPAHRERVFERFYRVDPGRSREMGGTGLGLSIVKHLVEQMGGAVGVEAAAPHGARFWFTLPASGGQSLDGPDEPHAGERETSGAPDPAVVPGEPAQRPDEE